MAELRPARRQAVAVAVNTLALGRPLMIVAYIALRTGVMTMIVIDRNYDAITSRLVGRLDAPVMLAGVGKNIVDIGTTLVVRGVENIARWKS